MTMEVRDTYVALSATTFDDVGALQSAGVRKTQYSVTCTKS
jgi:hypothetical protein